jgi:hypothetical protein
MTSAAGTLTSRYRQLAQQILSTLTVTRVGRLSYVSSSDCPAFKLSAEDQCVELAKLYCAWSVIACSRSRLAGSTKNDNLALALCLLEDVPLLLMAREADQLVNMLIEAGESPAYVYARSHIFAHGECVELSRPGQCAVRSYLVKPGMDAAFAAGWVSDKQRVGNSYAQLLTFVCDELKRPGGTCEQIRTCCGLSKDDSRLALLEFDIADTEGATRGFKLSADELRTLKAMPRSVMCYPAGAQAIPRQLVIKLKTLLGCVSQRDRAD